MNLFLELSAVFFLATIIASCMRLLKQPITVGFIITGIIAGPYVFNLLHSTTDIELFSKIGITVLLFIVGLNLSPQVIKDIGKVSLLVGLGQIAITSLLAYIIALLLKYSAISSWYIALALTFSSTIIILKLLSDIGDLQKLYGKISIGLLIIQDVVVSILLLFITTNGGSTTNSNPLATTIFFIMKAILLLLFLYSFSTYILPRVSKFMASSQELLFIFSIGWGLGLASLFYKLGFSVEIGSLLAGITLSMTPFAFEIAARMKPLRDFFLILFFIFLGSQTTFGDFTLLLLPVIIFSVFVLFYKPLFVFIIMNLLGFKRKTSFLTGLTVSQISEFSLILTTIGFNQHILSQNTFSIITMVGLLSMTGSTYLVLYADKIYPAVEHYLHFLEFRKSKNHENMQSESYELVLFGFNRIGKHFIKAFSKMDKPYLVVDFNPESIKELKEMGIAHRFGDAEDLEFIHDLSTSNIKMAISIIHDFKTNILLTKEIKKTHPRAIIIILCDEISEAGELYAAGATYVIMPHFLGAEYAVDMITKHGINIEAFRHEREKHLVHLHKK